MQLPLRDDAAIVIRGGSARFFGNGILIVCDLRCCKRWLHREVRIMPLCCARDLICLNTPADDGVCLILGVVFLLLSAQSVTV